MSLQTSDYEHASFGPVLLTGGCGFLGWHLVGQLLAEASFHPVHVIDRATDRNIHAGAQYHTGSVTNRLVVKRLVDDIRPRIIFHTASPNAAFTQGAQDFLTTNITGTHNLLELATTCPSVEALIYTSSTEVYADPPHSQVDEAHPIWELDSPCESYNRTKAEADVLVRSANSSKLKTVCLRISQLYGLRSSQHVPLMLDKCLNGQLLARVGDGKALTSFLSVTNAASAHILAAKALMDPSRANGRVDGQAFNITDGRPDPFWRHVELTWSAALGRDVSTEMWTIPMWLAAMVFWFVQWAYCLFTLGKVETPTSWSRTALVHCTCEHTYSMEKALRVLGYNPGWNYERDIRESVAWEMQRRGRQLEGE